jgi:putative ABC transport system substrate-binding protein
MRFGLRRREFIAGLGGAATWPLVARAQQRATPVVGYFELGRPEQTATRLVAFRKGLSETGFVPIVFGNVTAPVASGIVPRLDRPSGNITGFANLEASLA